MGSILRHLSRKHHHLPRPGPYLPAPVIDPRESVDEETLPFYEPDHFYPVVVGEVIQSRYQILGKLGYGTYSTTWLGRDLNRNRYVALKISSLANGNPTIVADRDTAAYTHLNSFRNFRAGKLSIRDMYDIFDIWHEGRRFRCFVQQPMQLTLARLVEGRSNETGNLSENLVKAFSKELILTLEFLHSKTKIIHADLKASHIMFEIRNESDLQKMGNAEWRHPTPQKDIDGRKIYLTWPLDAPDSHHLGKLCLCDFGEARIGGKHHGIIQGNAYRAPEVILGLPWSYSVDIWNLGILIWEMFEAKPLFSSKKDGEYSVLQHLAEMTAYLGPPPIGFLHRSKNTDDLFDGNGEWLRPEGIEVPRISLQTAETKLKGPAQADFLSFIREMVTWKPEERKTARELLKHPWLKGA